MDILAMAFNARMGSVVEAAPMYEGCFDSLDDMTLLDTICKLETCDMRIAAAEATKVAEARGLIGTIDLNDEEPETMLARPVIAASAFARRLSAVVNEAIEYTGADQGGSDIEWLASAEANAIELPSATDLAWFDEQEAIMAEQYGLPVAQPVCHTKLPAGQYREAVRYAKDLPVEQRQYRITLFVAGHDITGQWCTHNARELQNQLALFASKGIGFSVEFKY